MEEKESKIQLTHWASGQPFSLRASDIQAVKACEIGHPNGDVSKFSVLHLRDRKLSVLEDASQIREWLQSILLSS